jgi:hypothetical protein
MKKVINKGYTLTVVSWENDGDNYNTQSKTVETLEESEKLYNICKKVFVSCHNGEKGVGNSMGGKSKHVLFRYIKNNQDLFPDLTTEDDILNYFYNLSDELLGGSEYYDFRVCESCTVTYSPEDVYLEEIKFNK